MALHNVIVIVIVQLVIGFVIADENCNISGIGGYLQPCSDAVKQVARYVNSTSTASNTGKCLELVQLMPYALQTCQLDTLDMQRESKQTIRHLEDAYRLFIDLNCDGLLTPSRPLCASTIDCLEGTAEAPGIFDKNIPGLFCGEDGERYEATKQCLEVRAQQDTQGTCSHLCKLVRAMAEARAKLC